MIHIIYFTIIATASVVSGAVFGLMLKHIGGINRLCQSWQSIYAEATGITAKNILLPKSLSDLETINIAEEAHKLLADEFPALSVADIVQIHFCVVCVAEEQQAAIADLESKL